MWACAEGADVICPYSREACAGDVCCPSAGNAEATFPCPSASANFSGCGTDEKVWDCRLGANTET